MTYEYQSRRFIPLEAFTAGKRKFLGLEKMLKPGQILVVDLKGTLFDLENSPKFYMHAVYSWDKGVPRFLRYIDRIVDGAGKAVAYRCRS